jgi:tetratricopeptide (TPR) repeat protein
VAYNNWGNALLKLGRPAEAIEQYQQALRIQPDYAESQYNWGNALVNTGQPAESIVHFEQSLRLRPDFAEAHCALGFALDATGRSAEALKHYRRAVEIDPDYVAAHYNLAMALAGAERWAESIEHLRQALRTQPKQPRAACQLIAVFLHSGNLAEAIAYGKEAARLMPEQPQIQRTVAWLLATHESLAKGDSATAVDLAERANGLTGGKDVACLDTLAAAYAGDGRFREAVATSNEARRLADAADQPALAQDIHMRLQLYRDGKPYREAGAAAKSDPR